MSEPIPNTKSKANILVSSHQQTNIAYHSDETLLETSEKNFGKKLNHLAKLIIFQITSKYQLG